MVKNMLLCVIGVVGGLALAVYLFMQTKPFGKLPSGERLQRVEQSPHYRDGEFQNLSPTRVQSRGKSRWITFYEFVFDKIDNLKPSQPIPSIKTDLHRLPSDQNWFVWFGHSSYLIQLDGKRFLVDPVLVAGSPLPFLNKMFDGANPYSPADMPNIDYLVITHDHWDHLDYQAVSELQPKVGKVITSLGVGSHLEYWGYPAENIVELDWYEQADLAENLHITALPSRHFSGRGLKGNQTLWSSFMLQGKRDNLYLGGDSGYDDFYQAIGKRFPHITLAIMENGQYNADWANIHIQPHELVRAIQELNPQTVIGVHNAKFALAKHSWKEPMERLADAAEQHHLPLVTPMIGEVFYFDQPKPPMKRWWQKIN